VYIEAMVFEADVAPPQVQDLVHPHPGGRRDPDERLDAELPDALRRLEPVLDVAALEDLASLLLDRPQQLDSDGLALEDLGFRVGVADDLAESRQVAVDRGVGDLLLATPTDVVVEDLAGDTVGPARP
jgi:hypothetical protein